MIQRIQTLYLALALGLMIPIFFSIYATYTPFVILSAAISLFLCGTIVLFKARKIQMRLCVYNSVLMLALQIWMGAVYYKNMADIKFSLVTVFPIVCFILTLLALRAIATDEAMVQSYNRLRGNKKK